MAITTFLRETVGPYALCAIPGFVELEAGIVAATDIRHLSSLGDAAGNPVAPFPGVIVAMSGGCEASSNFTVQATINGTEDTGNTMTVNSAAEYLVFKPATYPAFVAGDALGMAVVADTTSKDFKGTLWVLFDLSGE